MFKVTPIPAFNDNYIWALADGASDRIAVVDPGDAAPVQQYLRTHGLRFGAILITHHHHDHTGGVARLLAEYPVPVYGPHHSPFGGIDHKLRDGDSIELFGQRLEVREVPGHTLDHISYFSAKGGGQLFCGDTLFLAGCGRLFEGTAAQMQQAMDYFHSLPDSTEVYCTHEYSLANLAFAQAVEPANADIQSELARCRTLRANGHPTLPSHIGTEKRINPFMRTGVDSVRQSAGRQCGQTLDDDSETLAAVRAWKNAF